MGQQYHIIVRGRNAGKIGICRAQPGKCPLITDNGTVTPHGTREELSEYLIEQAKSEVGILAKGLQTKALEEKKIYGEVKLGDVQTREFKERMETISVDYEVSPEKVKKSLHLLQDKSGRMAIIREKCGEGVPIKTIEFYNKGEKTTGVICDNGVLHLYVRDKPLKNMFFHITSYVANFGKLRSFFNAIGEEMPQSLRETALRNKELGLNLI